MTDDEIKISPSEPLKLIVNYTWIKAELRKRLGYHSLAVESILDELDKEQHN